MPAIDLPAVFQTIASFAFSLILILVPILIRLLYPQVKAWLDAKVAAIEANLSVDQLRALRQAADMAVTAVEQLKKTGAILDNKHAFDAAQGIVQRWLASRGILLDITLLRAAIESAVNELPHSTPQTVADAIEQAR